MTYADEFKSSIKLALPIIFAQLSVIIMGVTDNVVVGKLLGTTALDISGIANSVAFTIASFGVGGLTVISPMISKANSENDLGKINALFRSSFGVVLGFVLLNIIVGGFCYFRFDLFGQTPEITKQAPSFLLILLASNIPMFLFVASRQFTDGLADTKVVMIITATAVLVNLALNFVFIPGLGPIKALGVNGSAWATLAARCFMFTCLVLYIFLNKKYQKYLNAKSTISTRNLIVENTKLSFLTGCQFFFEVAAFSLANIMMGWFGEASLAAHLIVLNVCSTTYMMSTGIAIAGSIRVGRARGLKSQREVQLAANVCWAITGIFMTVMSILILIFGRELLGLYIQEESVIQIGLSLLFVGALFQLSDGIQAASISLLRGLGDVNIPTLLTFIAYWVISLPLGYVLGFKTNLGPKGIWIALLVGLTVSAILLTIRFLSKYKKTVEN